MSGTDWTLIERAIASYAGEIPSVEEVARRQQVLARLQRSLRHLRRAAAERDLAVKLREAARED